MKSDRIRNGCGDRAGLPALLFLLIFALVACGGGGGGGGSFTATSYKPEGFAAIAGDQAAYLHWPRVAAATSYNLYWATAPGVSYSSNKTNSTEAHYEQSGLTNGTTYYYAYSIVTAEGESSLSTEASIVPNSQSAAIPEPVDAHMGDGRVEIRWNGVAGATAYNVYWQSSTGVTTSSTAITDATSPTLVTGLTNGKPYYFVVTAQTSGGESALSTEVVAVPFLSEPLRPTAVAVTSGSGSATLSWQPVAGATSYDIYWGKSAGISSASEKISTTGTSYTQTGLTNNTRYYYAIAANNSRGSSELSRELATTPAASISTIPSGVKVLAGSKSATITWPDVLGASSYTLRWYTSGGATQTITDVTSPYVHAGRTAGTTVFYSVSAVISGTTGTPSAEVAVTPSDDAPATPRRLVARAGREQISVESDEIDDALRYNIYWNATGNVTTGDVVIENVTLPYTQLSLTNGTRYYYRLAALNREGQSSLSDENSIVPNATRIADVVAAVTDSKLQACINGTAAAFGWFYLHQAISIECSGQGALDLTGLAQFTNLIRLFLESNTSTTGLTELDSLSNLSVFGVGNSDISDLSVLDGHFNVFAFRANANAVVDLSPLSGHTAMTELYLQDNGFTDLTPIAALDRMQYLWIGHNAATPGQISDLSPLNGMTSMLDLRVENNRVSNLSPVAGMTQMQVLWAEHDPADGSKLSDISALQNLTALQDLRLSHNAISTLTPLGGMKNLQVLVLFDNQVTALSALAPITSLVSLDLGSNSIQQAYLDSISGLTNLTRLVISDNVISSLTPVSGLTNLKELYAGYNVIQDASPAAALTNLEVLDLTKNSLGDASVGKISTLVSLTKATQILLALNPLISCSEVQVLINTLGASVVDIDGDINSSDDPASNQIGVNCS